MQGEQPPALVAAESPIDDSLQTPTADSSDATAGLTSHRNAPVPHRACLYGLVGEVACVGGDGTETNPYAIAANFMAYLSCAIGRGVYLPIGNTWHHTRLFCLHVGRSGRGRKGDALALVMRLDQAVRELSPSLAPQIHRGGLSSREGLVALMHDGFQHGRQMVAPIDDKRLWVVESEFANVLHQGRREGNTLSAALRDCWDGVCLKPATKTNRLYASHPHVCLSGAISPGELTGMMTARELTNGFANRFLVIWAERTQILPFPNPTPEGTVDDLAQRILKVLEFAGADQYACRDYLKMELSAQAQWRYAQLYRTELNEDVGSDLVNAMLERRAPMLLRLAMVFALTDLQLRIEIAHIDAAMAWMRYTMASIRYVFVSSADEDRMSATRDLANQIMAFLTERGKATRSEISARCLKGRVTSVRIDAAIEHLLAATPPKVCVDWIARPRESPGAPTRIYRLADS